MLKPKLNISVIGALTQDIDTKLIFDKIHMAYTEHVKLHD